MENPAVTIIGTGSLGGVLSQACSDAGFSIQSIYNRSQPGLDKVEARKKAKYSGKFPTDKSALGEVTFITVPDRTIKEVADQLAGLSDDFSNHFFVHCSGTKSSGELDSLKAKGAKVASFHPLQTFSASSGPNDLKNIYFDVEGDAEAVSFLKGLAKWWQSETVEITPEAKPYFHASAVVASNYLVALLAAASDIAALGGMGKSAARKALIPLVQKTLKNSAEAEELPAVLSGPIARGDASTVAEHIALLKKAPHLQRLYKVMGQETLKLAKAGKKADTAWKELEKLLEEDNE